MHARALIAGVLFLLATSLFAGTEIYDSYEGVRQALLKNSVADVQSRARNLAADARAEKQDTIAAQADSLARATDITSARRLFGQLSEEMMKAGVSGDHAVVAYCPMAKKSWLQPAGTPISNPYLDGGMRSCGQFVKDR